MLNAARAGNVVISSAVGNGVGDDKLVYTYVPTIIEYYLGEKPLVANVDTYRCWLDDEREEVLDRVDELVIKPVEGSGGYGIVFGPNASEKELATISKKIRNDPRGWIAQPVVQLSTVPTQIDDKLAPRHVDLRPFAVNDGDDVWVLPGGLTRVALPEGSLVVNSSQGGGSKDTWVLASRASVRRPRAGRRRGGPQAAQGAKGREGRQERRLLASSSNNSSRSRRAPARARAAAATTTAGGDGLMLARNAESLYWIGRYVERADDTARILDVTVHQLLEDSSVDPDQTSRTLLRVLGIDPPEQALDVWSLTDLVAFSRDTKGGCSIVESISAARENARGAREVTSTEIWECLNTTYNALPERERAAKRLGPAEFLSFVEGRAAMFAGLADSTLSRDDGYRFMVLGRAIERVDMTVRLLLSRVGDSASSPAWVTVLRSAGAHDTYLRTYRGVLDAGRVVEFMLLDRLFPRSVFYSLRLAEHSLDELHHRALNRVGATAEAQRLLGRARSELEFLRPGVLLESLEQRLASLQKTCTTSEKRWRWSTSTPRPGWRGRMPAAPARWSSRKARSRCGACGWCTRPAMRTSRR